jgi:hypothetical protein
VVQQLLRSARFPLQTMSYGMLMAVMMPRERWTDERLDDLNAKVDAGFARVDEDIRELRGEMNARFDKVDSRFEKIDLRFDSLNRTLITVGGAIIAALIGVNVF